ncbi:MAG: hypothetical protein HDT33_02585 [Clostridiales bacterium]|nr:hypothetical protein [Clostridiales bacterium]
MMKTLSGADCLLLMLYLEQQAPVFGAVRLTKMMFIFEKEISKRLKNSGIDYTNPPNFFAYNYGPFSKDVYEQVELFRGIGFLNVEDINATEEMAEVDDWEEAPFIDEMVAQEKSRLNKDGRYYKYTLTLMGKRYVEAKIITLLTQEQIEFLSEFKKKIIQLPPKAILKYVYTNYPDYTSKSVIKDEVLGDG